MKDLISIIIPTFNRDHIIGETLDSILAQTFTKWECIAVDDGSTDNTIKLLHKYRKKDKRFKFFSRPVNKVKGPSSCRNYGLEKALGEFVLFLDSDDLLASYCLEQRLEIANKFSKYDFWIFKTKVFHDEINDLNKIFNLELNNYSDARYLNLFLEGKYPFCILGPLWKKETLKELNGFDEKLNVFEDPDLHIRAFLNNFKSKSCLTKKADSFYRISKPQKKIKIDNQKINKVHNSAFVFFKKYIKLKKEMVEKHAYYYFKDDILRTARFEVVLKFYYFYIKNGIFTIPQMIILPIIYFYLKFNLDNRKGLGYSKMNKLVRF